MTDHDLIQDLLGSARTTHIGNTLRQQRRRAMASESAEDRAFHGEQAQRRTEDLLRQERQEHTLTQVALQRLVARNEAMRRLVRQLCEKWAPLDGSTAVEMETSFARQCDAKVQEWLDSPASQSILERAADHVRDSLRVVPKQRG